MAKIPLEPCAPGEPWCKAADGPEAGPDSPITSERIEQLGACGVRCAGGNAELSQCGLRTALSAWVIKETLSESVRMFGRAAFDVTAMVRLEGDILSGKADPAKCLSPMGNPRRRETPTERAWRRRHEDRLYEQTGE